MARLLTRFGSLFALSILAGLAAARLEAQACVPHLLGADRRGPASALARSGVMTYVGAGGALVVVDAADPLAPIERGHANLDGIVLDVASWGWTAIALVPGAIEFVDAADPARPQVVGSFPLAPGWDVWTLDARDSMVFFPASDGLHIVSFADPASPAEIGMFPIAYADDVAARNGRAYLLANRVIHVLDVGDPAAPVEVAAVPAPRDAVDHITVAPSGTRLATWGLYSSPAYDGGDVAFFDLADPDLPVQRSVLTYYDDNPPEAVAFGNGRGYVSHSDYQEIYDLASLANPELAGTFPAGWIRGAFVAADPDYLLLADAYAGLRIFDVSSPATAHEVAAVATPNRTLDGYFVGPYAVTVNERGLRVFDVSQPDQPVLAGSFSTQEEWFRGELTRLGPVAWAQSDYPSRYVAFDLGDPAAPVRLGTFGEDFAARPPSVDRDRALVPAGPPAPILDVSDPASPVEIGALTNLGSFVVDAVLKGDRAYAWTTGSSQPERLWIYDVTQPASPLELGVTVMPFPARSAVRGATLFARGYTTFATFDVSDPAHVQPLGSLALPESGASRRVALYGARAFLGPDYAESPARRTFRIVDVGDPSQPALLALLPTAGDAENVFAGPGRIGVADGEAGFSLYESCIPFADGFESGDASAWSAIQP